MILYVQILIYFYDLPLNESKENKQFKEKWAVHNNTIIE